MEQLPPWVQVLLSIGAFLVAAWAYLRGMLKAAPPSKDIVVPSVTIADAHAIREMAAQLRLNSAVQQQDLALRHETLHELRRLNGQIEDIKHYVERIEARK
ncbi:hypothetical protein [Terrihabitans sp. B22-R8]|uniref:hypothetical protein n=1 Tax=Terrihabitans sp. B22-R8 TaxID=3425128 RepID=UPI00403C4041